MLKPLILLSFFFIFKFLNERKNWDFLSRKGNQVAVSTFHRQDPMRDKNMEDGLKDKGRSLECGFSHMTKNNS